MHNHTPGDTQNNCMVQQLCVPKEYGTVYLCLDLARHSQALIRPVHRDQTVNDIFPRLTNALIDASLG